MTSSSSFAISYPTLKGLQTSNSNFVQITSAPKNRSNFLSKNSSAVASSSCPNRCSDKLRREISSKFENPIQKNVSRYDDDEMKPKQRVGKPLQNDNEQVASKSEQVKVGKSKRDVSIKPKSITEKPQQSCDIGVLPPSDSIQTVSEDNAESTVTHTDLVKSEYFQNLESKYPNHTLIINNTFVNPTSMDQDEFVIKLKQSFYNYNNNNNNNTTSAKILSICNTCQAAQTSELNSQQDDVENLTKFEYEEVVNGNKIECLKRSKKLAETKNIHMMIAELSPEDIAIPHSLKRSVPVGSIFIGILWILLIVFWFLMYLKVLNVYKSEPSVILQCDPTNYEMCLMVLSRFRKIIDKFLWKF